MGGSGKTDFKMRSDGNIYYFKTKENETVRCSSSI